MPPFGTKTKLFPYGYGYCQCGCGHPTLRTDGNNYGTFLHGHFITGQEGTFSKDSATGDPRFFSPQHESGASDQEARPVVKSKKFLPPDQALLDEYKKIAVKYSGLQRETQLLLLEFGQSLKLLNDLWIDGGELKETVINKLGAALARFESSK